MGSLRRCVALCHWNLERFERLSIYRNMNYPGMHRPIFKVPYTLRFYAGRMVFETFVKPVIHLLKCWCGAKVGFDIPAGYMTCNWTIYYTIISTIRKPTSSSREVHLKLYRCQTNYHLQSHHVLRGPNPAIIDKSDFFWNSCTCLRLRARLSLSLPHGRSLSVWTAEARSKRRTLKLKWPYDVPGNRELDFVTIKGSGHPITCPLTPGDLHLVVVEYSDLASLTNVIHFGGKDLWPKASLEEFVRFQYFTSTFLCDRGLMNT